MKDQLAWLPPLVLLNQYGGDWKVYLDAIYQYFLDDFVNCRPSFNGRRLALKKHPLSQGKEATFWHLISEGADEADRIPDFRRCERIRWPKPLIDHSREGHVRMWKNQRRGGEQRICLWIESEDYLVVLADRGDYVLLWTAYLVERAHQKRKLLKEHDDYWSGRP